jgi:Domain of unknown function (DUF1735)
MKRNNFNRIFKLGLLSMAVAFIGQSCVKSVSGRTDFENLQATVLIPEGGLQNLTIDALLFPPDPTIVDKTDTTFFHLNYAATDVAPVDEVITIAIDPDALAAYNAQGGNQYLAFPDSIFEFTTTSVTVPKGANYSAAVPLVIHSNKVDPTKSYMLPISIKAAPAGAIISSNFKTIYYHLIGNPIAGLYGWDWYRWNNNVPVGPNTGGTPALGGTAVFAPLDVTTVEVPSGYYIGPRYHITFVDSSGILVHFAVEFNADDVATMKAGGVTITNGPNITTADPITGVYQFWYSADNGAPTNNLRYVIDKYYK